MDKYHKIKLKTLTDDEWLYEVPDEMLSIYLKYKNLEFIPTNNELNILKRNIKWITIL